MDSDKNLTEYESRMMAINRELQERRMLELCRKEKERVVNDTSLSDKLDREEEELRRLRAMREEQERRLRAQTVTVPPYAQRQEQRLAALREQIKRQEEENKRLSELIKASARTKKPALPRKIRPPPMTPLWTTMQVPCLMSTV